ncbi:MAG: hypothetical protein ACHQAY_04570 [Hyphomicrobiales bacterium]
MKTTSMSELPPDARIDAANCDELPSFRATVAPVAFSKAATWQALTLSANEPPKDPTTNSSACAEAATDKPADNIAIIAKRAADSIFNSSPMGRGHAIAGEPAALEARASSIHSGEAIQTRLGLSFKKDN